MHSTPSPMSETAVPAGHLFVVATPIGNLGDLSPRAQSVLAQVDAICAEDTRNSGALLAHFGLRKPLLALHDHNESAQCAALIERLRGGQSLALISDAGTPLVSDPGFVLVRAARDAGISVVTVPGPCAAIAALSICGLPSDRFSFEGFLPARHSARIERLRELAKLPQTQIVYESSHRIADCAADIAAVYAERDIGIARELTKLHEESARMPAHALPLWLAQNAWRTRGEFVLLLPAAPAQADTETVPADAERVLRLLLEELPASRAARIAAQITGAKRKPLYELALRLSPEGDAP